MQAILSEVTVFHDANIRQFCITLWHKKTSSQIFHKQMKNSEFLKSVKNISINYLTQDMDHEH